MTGEVQLEPPGVQSTSDSDPLLDNNRDSNEIKDDDVEAGSVTCCRICLECDSAPGVFDFSLIDHTPY